MTRSAVTYIKIHDWQLHVHCGPFHIQRASIKLSLLKFTQLKSATKRIPHFRTFVTDTVATIFDCVKTRNL